MNAHYKHKMPYTNADKQFVVTVPLSPQLASVAVSSWKWRRCWWQSLHYLYTQNNVHCC